MQNFEPGIGPPSESLQSGLDSIDIALPDLEVLLDDGGISEIEHESLGVLGRENGDGLGELVHQLHFGLDDLEESVDGVVFVGGNLGLSSEHQKQLVIVLRKQLRRTEDFLDNLGSDALVDLVVLEEHEEVLLHVGLQVVPDGVSQGRVTEAAEEGRNQGLVNRFANFQKLLAVLDLQITHEERPEVVDLFNIPFSRFE